VNVIIFRGVDVTPWSVCTDVSEETRASIIRWIYSGTRVMEAEDSSETSACVCKSVLRHIPEDISLPTQRNRNVSVTSRGCFKRILQTKEFALFLFVRN
jgi:hypothetical protein